MLGALIFSGKRSAGETLARVAKRCSRISISNGCGAEMQESGFVLSAGGMQLRLLLAPSPRSGGAHGPLIRLQTDFRRRGASVSLLAEQADLF